MGKFLALEKNKVTQKWSLEDRATLAYFLELKSLAPIESWNPEDVFFGFLESGSLKHNSKTINEHDSIILPLPNPTAPSDVFKAETELKIWILTYKKWNDMKSSAPVISIKLLEEALRLTIQAAPPNSSADEPKEA